MTENDKNQKYFCIYCKENHPKEEFYKNYQVCYDRIYGYIPPKITLEEYMNRCSMLGEA